MLYVCKVGFHVIINIAHRCAYKYWTWCYFPIGKCNVPFSPLPFFAISAWCYGREWYMWYFDELCKPNVLDFKFGFGPKLIEFLGVLMGCVMYPVLGGAVNGVFLRYGNMYSCTMGLCCGYTGARKLDTIGLLGFGSLTFCTAYR